MKTDIPDISMNKYLKEEKNDSQTQTFYMIILLSETDHIEASA